MGDNNDRGGAFPGFSDVCSLKNRKRSISQGQHESGEKKKKKRPNEQGEKV